MSVILEALEKKQKKDVKKESYVSVPQPKIISIDGEDKGILLSGQKKTSHKTGVYILFVALSIIITGLLIFNWWLDKEEGLYLNGKTAEAIGEKELQAERASVQNTVVLDNKAVLTVTGIVWDPVEPIALINGEFFGVGDIILGASIKDIQIDNVTFLYNNEEFVVKVNPASPNVARGGFTGGGVKQ